MKYDDSTFLTLPFLALLDLLSSRPGDASLYESEYLNEANQIMRRMSLPQSPTAQQKEPVAATRAPKQKKRRSGRRISNKSRPIEPHQYKWGHGVLGRFAFK